MKFSHFALGLMAIVSPVTAAWSKEDREIFRIRDEIAAHEADTGATFYEILGISNRASQDDINKAYKLKTRQLHPDKVAQQLRAERKKEAKSKGVDASKGPTQKEIKRAVKRASERQARLSLIANILRGEGRQRYDHYLSNGFPLWKGTDYFYNRYRPGLGTVMTGTFIMIAGAVHYLILYMGFKRQKEFVNRYVKHARDTAWGGNMIPAVETTPEPVQEEEEEGPRQPMNRRERRMQAKETRKDGVKPKKAVRKAAAGADSPEPSTGPQGQRKRVMAENGKVLVVDSLGDVYLEGQDDDGNLTEFLLDPDEIPVPTIMDTALVRVPLFFYDQTVGRAIPRKSAHEEIEVYAEDEDSDVPQNTPSTDSAGEDFEMLDKSVDSLGKAKSTGTQKGGKASKRKVNKKK